jgi:hypothetical protein
MLFPLHRPSSHHVILVAFTTYGAKRSEMFTWPSAKNNGVIIQDDDSTYFEELTCVWDQNLPPNRWGLARLVSAKFRWD